MQTRSSPRDGDGPQWQFHTPGKPAPSARPIATVTRSRSAEPPKSSPEAKQSSRRADVATRPRGAAFIPFQLSDEMYANILRDEGGSFPVQEEGDAVVPKFGYILLVKMCQRKAALGSWPPKSWTNASSRLLLDGVTELVRNYSSRRPKTDEARGALRAFTLYQRSVYHDIKERSPGLTPYEIKARVGEQWRAMGDDAKKVYRDEAERSNRLLRQRLASANPSELLVRHEMWIQRVDAESGARSKPPAWTLVHYLGDAAFQNLTARVPRPHHASTSRRFTSPSPRAPRRSRRCPSSSRRSRRRCRRCS